VHNGVITLCPLYFWTHSSSGECHYADQSIIIIHELTHLPEIWGTHDTFKENRGVAGGYGYDKVRSLRPDQNLYHADTYALFAQGNYFQNPSCIEVHTLTKNSCIP